MKSMMFGITVVAMMAAVSACGGGGSGDGGACPTSEPASCITGGSGEWSVHETASTSSSYCIASNGEISDYTITVTQTGCRISVVADGNTFNGFIDGNRICWTGSYPDNGGTTTIENMSLTVNDAGTEFSGSSSWTWTDGVGTCNGTTTTQGEKT
jgi:hypothetical protein